MKSKRMLSLFLSLVMALSIFNIGVLAYSEETSTIKVYITVSKYGEIAGDKERKAIAAASIELNDKASYNLDDVFTAAHDLYYEGGADAGYASDNGEYGLYITKFWGDESGNFGYQVNGGTEPVMGLSHEVKDGDYIDVCIYKNTYPDTENYTKFDKVNKEVFVNEAVELTLSEAGYDENWNTVFAPCSDADITVNGENRGIKTDKDGRATLSFDSAGEYIVSAVKTKELNSETVPAICAPVCIVTVKDYPDAHITIPKDAMLYVGLKGSKHFVSFTEIESCAKIDNGETSTYYFELENNKTYNYRITSDSYITYAGKFKKTADFGLTITEEMLRTEGKTKTTVDRDTSSNNGHNVADIYLNINAQGYLKLNENDTYQIVNLRNWEAVDSITSNYFLEPDYHYTVIDENGEQNDSVIAIDEKGLITALEKGTVIVLVTYDAMNIDFGSGKEFYGAIWPENTGVFVVSVGTEESGIATGMTINEGKNSDTVKLSGDAIDAEHDVIYFAGESGFYTFTPETEGVSVFAANPTEDTTVSYRGFSKVEKNADSSFTVPLKNGRNIVKLTKDGKSEYQVITAKKVSITVNNEEEVHAGDALNIVFDTLYHPANKLAGVYNMTAIPVYTKVSGYEDKFSGGSSAQYNFANNANSQKISNVLKEKNAWGVISYEKDTELTVPDDYQYDTFILSGGMLYASGWGDAYGNHRGITLTDGKAPNLTSEVRLGWLGSLPDIEIPIAAPSDELKSISLDATNVKKDYYAGDRFDTTNLIVTANYDNDKTQTALNYTVTPEILTEDTERVIITYRGKTAEIDVNVKTAKVTAIEITVPPAKTTYNEGDIFDPTGMVVTATYENGTKKEIIDYSYAPNRILMKTDTEMTVTYTGEDKNEEVISVNLPITVNASAQEGDSQTPSDTITVYFTLYGDDKHGEPDESTGTHTMLSNNLKLWISNAAVTVDKGSFVIDAATKALSIAGIPYTNADGNYISEIKGLKELDNGSLSGWMYILNGKYPNLGVSEQTLKDGDKIVFHYTDDYTKEGNSVSSSSGGGGSVASIYTVKFETNGADAIKSQTAEKNGTITKPQNPKKEGYVFDGWFTDKELTKEYDFTSKVTASFTLYAKWIEDKEDTKEEEKSEFGENIFSDVGKDDWYYDAVNYVYENNLMQGTDKGFEPDSSMTRAMLVTVLYRMENPTEKIEQCGFDDVEEDAWYAEAVAWAAKNEIVKGINETVFAPNDNVSREQTALILYRYAMLKGYDTKTDSELMQFDDKSEISDWAAEAINWAIAEKIMNGTSDTTISPKDTATRAQTAAILMRFCERIKK